MDNILLILFSILQISILDITLSGDNVSVIALAIRNLPEKQAKLASLVGVVGAVGLRIIFTCIISLIMAIDWLPIKLIGGILLLKITWDLLRIDEEEHRSEVNADKGLWRAITSIIIADLSMGLDNVLAIAGAAHGNLWLIIFGLGLSIPIIFFGAKYVAELMNKYEIIVYIGAALLIYTAVSMITEDNLTSRYISDNIGNIAAVISASIVMVYGVITIRLRNLRKKKIRGKDIFISKKKYRSKSSKKV